MKKRFWFIAGVLIVVLAIQLKNAIFIDYKVEGISMNPTFKQGNELMVNKFSHRYKTIRRFDIVLFKGAPQSADQTCHRAPRRVNRIQGGSAVCEWKTGGGTVFKTVKVIIVRREPCDR